jgi:glucoamylase
MSRRYGLVAATVPSADLGAVAQYLLPLMLRNVSSTGFVFTDPADPTRFSAPGCIIASPSFELDLASVRQNYVFNWVRDAAVAATEIAEAHQPVWGGGSGPLIDYVSFAGACQQNAPTLARACFTIEGQPRDWTDQNDGPALQTLAVMRSYHQLDTPAQATAQAVVQRNLDFVMASYRSPSFNLWEETFGQSFFTRSVQLRCLVEIRSNDLGFAVPNGVDQAVDWLARALQDHWNGEYYVSILDPQHPRDGYDPNIDIVMASVYGAVSCTDGRLLATAAALRRQWAEAGSPSTYPVNAADASSGRGPLLGRYPGDVFDATTGFEKSVRSLTWSYAAFLSAVRARTAAASAAST